MGHDDWVSMMCALALMQFIGFTGVILSFWQLRKRMERLLQQSTLLPDSESSTVSADLPQSQPTAVR